MLAFLQSLGIDQTCFVQFFFLCCSYFLLKYFYFRPFLALIHARRQTFTAVHDYAKSLNQNAQTIQEELQKTYQACEVQEKHKMQQSLDIAQMEQTVKAFNARQKTKQILLQALETSSLEKQKTLSALSAQLPIISKAIQSKVWSEISS